MKYSVCFLALIQFVLLGLTASAQGNGYKIDVTIDNYSGEKTYLGFRRADKVYKKDSTTLVNGKYVFEGQEALPPGIYLVLMPPDNKFFEFVVTKAEQRFSVSTKAPEFGQSTKIKGSKDNELLQEYQRYMSSKVEESKKLQEQIAAETDEKKKAKLKAEVDDLSKAVRERQNNFIKDNPGTYTAKLIAAFQEAEIPEPPKKADGTIDSTFQFRYYRSHFWDGFDFSDEIWVNTPYLKEKADRFLDKLTLQSPDLSLIHI